MTQIDITGIAKGKIGNALTSTAKNHIVAVANDLYDEELGGYQSEINKTFNEYTGLTNTNISDLSGNTETAINTLSGNTVDAINDLEERTAQEIDELASAVTMDIEVVSANTTEQIQTLSANTENLVQTTVSAITSSINQMANASDVRLKNIELWLISKDAELNPYISKTVIEKGKNNSITISGNTNTGDCILRIKEGNTLLVSSTTKEITYTTTINDAVTYNISLEFNNSIIRSINKSCSAYNYILYGFGKTENDITTKLGSLVSSGSRTYSGTCSQNQTYFYILIPNGVTVPTSFTMGGAPYVMNKTSGIKIGDITYTVIKSGAIYNTGAKLKIIAS